MTTPLQAIGNRLARLRRDALAHFKRDGMRDYPSYQTRMLGERLMRLSDDARALPQCEVLALLGTNRADWLALSPETVGRNLTMFDLAFVGMEWSATRRGDEWNTALSAPLMHVAGAVLMEASHTPEGEVAFAPLFESLGFPGADDA